MARRRIRAIFLPPNSPDLNPIENLFGVLKRCWAEAQEVRGVEEKVRYLLEHRITQTTIDNLCTSMTRRLTALRKAKGHATGY